VATIIPSAACATKNRGEVQRLFYCGGANARFSGVVMYSTLEDGGYTLCVDRYQSGRVIARRDIYSADTAGAKAMAALVGKAKIIKKTSARARTKGGEEWWNTEQQIEEVVVTAPAGNGSGGGYVHSWPAPTIPSKTNGSSGVGELPTGITDGGGGGGAPGNNDDNSSSGSLGDTLRIGPGSCRIFSGRLTNLQWVALQKMVERIMEDCMGGKLYNMLSGKPINIEYDYFGASATYNHASNTITIKYIADYNDVFIHAEHASLFHEMFHAYQYRNLTDADKRKRGNLEAEDKIAQAMFMMHEDADKNFKQWVINYNILSSDELLWQSAQIAERLTKTGELSPNFTENRFNDDFYCLANAIHGVNNTYEVDASWSIHKNLENLRRLAIPCL
jgi:hypothetical protein